ncbi:SurA N-terminal domain-containing protein [Janibacter hoylei]|uniref:SurA N-terminal domain-containing protein n=1 Tax=Janibacter hoylei TaxID=364298 RepID=UPI00223856F9|nr:SurA N-terminal domain-containing protein [Janibacter hoylei]MCW4601191.1 SurA N-terminal domain-containing protein [Janibacter hoylei]
MRGSDDGGPPAEGSSAVAATVDGQEITVGDVQRTTRELRTFLEAQAASSGQQPQQLDTDGVVTLLVQTPGVLDYAQEQGKSVPSAGSVRKSLEQVLPSASDVTIDFLRANAVSAQLDETERTELVEHIESQRVSVSPRYAAARDETPDWIKAPVEQQTPLETP